MSSFPPDSFPPPAFPPDLARSVAERLAAETDRDLPMMTERALAQQSGAQVPSGTTRAFDPGTTIALAALVVSVSQFAWGIYRDLKKDRQEERERQEVQQATTTTSQREVILRRTRMHFNDTPRISSGERDRLIEVVVDELLLRESNG